MTFSTSINLTEQQQAIVQHQEGPALVFAVAGAGKTTAMVHRVERLVRERVFASNLILATSFNKAAVDDIRKALEQWPRCARVQTKTLHGIGYTIISRAARAGYLNGFDLNTGDKNDLDRQILYRALNEARRLGADFVDELESFDQDDFLNYVGASKGNLRYADLRQAELSPAALKVARQASAPAGLEWYLDLYQLCERIRQAEGLITYDDMLMTGWELLTRHADLLQELRGMFRCVLVDEFQDVNRAQDAILDLLTYPHRNYMVIGDDDQTIYEWRGASPDFILDFKQRYKAHTYLINDNFRCPAAQVALANRVIEHNRRREPKHLSLTRGFQGSTLIHHAPDPEQQAQTFAGEIKSALTQGYRHTDIAVLVRLYAQTPYIEQQLIEAGIPYRVAGSTPFYQRPEIVTLLNYCRLAVIDAALMTGHTLDNDMIADLARAWGNVYNRPKRYLSKQQAEHVRSQVVFHNAPLHRALAAASADAPHGQVGERMRELADTLRWLTTALDSQPASNTLRDLDATLKYQAFLRESSGFPETGEGRAASVAAFIDYARNQGTLRQLLAHIDAISAGMAGRDTPATRDAVEVTTIFRAKGREWPVVFVPDCNDGIYPFSASARPEEERRLLYVAVTRSKAWLHLGISAKRKVSPFLTEANYRETLEAVESLERALQRGRSSWQAQDGVTLTRQPRQLRFERYFAQWWDGAPERRAAIARFLDEFRAAVARRDALALLGMSAERDDFWSRELFADAATADDVLGLDALIATLRAEEAKRVAGQRTIHTEVRAVPKPVRSQPARRQMSEPSEADDPPWW